MDILTVDEVAALLKMTRDQVYTLTRARSRARMDKPIPVLRINSNLRFRRSDLDAWLADLAKEGR